MNNTDLKTMFYKRYDSVTTRLIASSAGFAAPLIGYLCSDSMAAIGTALSMRTDVMARKTGDMAITVTSASCDMRRRYSLIRPDGRDRVSEFLRRSASYGLSGGQMLFSSSIPHNFDPHIPYTAAILKAAFAISDIPLPGLPYLTELCAKRNERNFYNTIFSEQKGFCTYCDLHSVKRLPLPMTGFKFVFADARVKPAPFSEHTMERIYLKLKSIYPGIRAFSDVSENMISCGCLKPDMLPLARHLISEHKRIIKAAGYLSAYNLKRFATVMTESFYSQKRILHHGDSRVFICDLLLGISGIIGVRICGNSVIAIADESVCDYAANTLVTSFTEEFGHEPIVCITD